jgi:flagellar basal body-associated protein FliL
MIENSEDKQKSSKKETIGYISAVVIFLIAIGTVWQVFLKGKVMEQKDTVVQVKVDTIRIKDSLNKVNKTTSPIDNNTNSNTEIKSASEKDTARFNRLRDSVKSKISNTDPKELSTEEKKTLKEEFKKLPPKKQDRIKRKLKSEMNK